MPLRGPSASATKPSEYFNSGVFHEHFNHTNEDATRHFWRNIQLHIPLATNSLATAPPQ
jgi:hypothetical protein